MVRLAERHHIKIIKVIAILGMIVIWGYFAASSLNAYGECRDAGHGYMYCQTWTFWWK